MTSAFFSTTGDGSPAANTLVTNSVQEAEQWASNPYNEELDFEGAPNGAYSALHWAAVAQNAVSSLGDSLPFTAITGDPLTNAALNSEFLGKRDTGVDIPQAEVTGLVAALAAKMNVGETIAQSDVTDLVADLALKADASALAAKADLAHTHTRSDITDLVPWRDLVASDFDVNDEYQIVDSDFETELVVAVSNKTIVFDPSALNAATLATSGPDGDGRYSGKSGRILLEVPAGINVSFEIQNPITSTTISVNNVTQSGQSYTITSDATNRREIVCRFRGSFIFLTGV